MGTIVEELVIALGLDPSDFTKGQKQVADGLIKTRNAADATTRDMESSFKRGANSLASMKNEVLGLLLALGGANSLKNFAAGIIDNDAAVGRLSANIGVSTLRIGAWQGVTKEMGGSANDAASALSAMSSAISEYQLTRTTGNDAAFRALGVDLNDLQAGPEAMLMKIAKAGEHMNRRNFVSLAQMIGLPPSVIASLEQGTGALRAQLDVQERTASITQKDAQAAQALQAKLADLSTLIQGKARPFITELADAMTQLLSSEHGAKDAGEGIAGLLGGIGAAAAIANPEVVGLGVALFGLIRAMDLLSTRQGRARIHNNVAEDEAFLSHFWAALHGDPKGMFARVGQVFSDAEAGKYRTDNTGGWGSEHAPKNSGVPAPARPTGSRHVALDGNNPGGINNSAFAMRQPGYAGANGRYARFDTMAHGEAAQEALLAFYVAHGYDTAAKIAARWAPASDGNNPGQYAANIARLMGVGVNEHIGLAQINRFAAAQGRAENSAYRGGTHITVHVHNPKDAAEVARNVHSALRRRTATSANSGLQ